jgi:hypothetical protein
VPFMSLRSRTNSMALSRSSASSSNPRPENNQVLYKRTARPSTARCSRQRPNPFDSLPTKKL